MKTLITIVSIALALSMSANASKFDHNPFEIHEVNVLEEGLTPDFLK